MPTFIMLTRLTPDAVKSPSDLRRLEKALSEHVRRDLPDVRWKANYAVLGPCDYLDIFEAPNEEQAARVAMLARSFGHARTEMWTALNWERFRGLIPE